MKSKTIGGNKEKLKLNVARLKKEKETFEVVIDAIKALDFKKGKINDVRDAVKSEHIFDDAKKGMLASEARLKQFFKTTDTLKIAEEIIKKGELQLTEQYRIGVMDDKRKRIIDLIHQNAIDPKTRFPIPIARIENAFEEAKIKINEKRTAEDQIADIMSKLKPIMPIKFDTKKIEIRIPQKQAKAGFNAVKNFGTMLKDEKKSDGSILFTIEIPAGMQDDFFDALNRETHGSAETKIK